MLLPFLDNQEEAKREWSVVQHQSDGTGVIRIYCSVKGKGANLQVKRGRLSEWKHEWAEFGEVTQGFFSDVEPWVSNTTIGEDPRDITTSIDYTELRLRIIRGLLNKWSLDGLLIEKDDGGLLTKECFRRIMDLHPRLLNCFLDALMETVLISEEEDKVIEKQSAILFSPHGQGVENACDAVTKFCVYSNFADKFGLNCFDLRKLPQVDFLRLRILMTRESESRDAMVRSEKAKNSISTPGHRGGRITVPNPR